MNYSLRSRLITAFAIVVAGLLITAGMAFFTINRLNRRLDHVYTADFRPYQQASNASFAFMQWQRSAQALIDAQSDDDVRRYELMAQQRATAITQSLERLLADPLSAEGRDLLTRVVDSLQMARVLQGRLEALVREGRRDTARGIAIAQLRPVTASIEALFAEYLHMQQRQFKDILQASDQDFVGALTRISVVAFLVLLVSVSSMVFVYRLVNATMRKVHTATQELSSSTSQIVTTTAQFAANSAQTGTAISEITSTVEETRQTARVASEKARFVADSAERVSRVSENGRDIVEQTIDTMNAIQHEMNSVAQSIVRLSEQSQAVGEITGSVNELAEQTNILSVNASIEAARAGEHGKGFSVVAQEIRNLAERSKDATAKIREILTDIQKATNAAVLTTEQASKKVDAGVSRSSQTREALEVLGNAVNESAQAAIQIAASSSQQLAGMDQVAEAMSNINQATHQNVSGSRQLEQAMRNLDELGLKLKDVVRVL